MLYANAQKFYRQQFPRRQETLAAIPPSDDAPNFTVKPADSEQTVSEWKDVEDLTTVSLRSFIKKAEEEIAVVAQSVRSRGDSKFFPFLKNFGRRNQGSEHRLPELSRDKSPMIDLAHAITTNGVKINNYIVPAFLKVCADVIMEKGLEAQGIFRISGMKNEVDAFVHNHGTADTVEFTNEVNVYSVADAFKLFLARLQSPVIPIKLYPLLKHIWINRAMEDTSELNAKQIDFQSLQQIKSALFTLPTAERHVLRFTLDLANKIAEHSEKNDMVPRNLALMLCPNLFRFEVVSVDDYKWSTELLSALLELNNEQGDYGLWTVNWPQEAVLEDEDNKVETKEKNAGSKDLVRKNKNLRLKERFAKLSLTVRRYTMNMIFRKKCRRITAGKGLHLTENPLNFFFT